MRRVKHQQLGFRSEVTDRNLSKGKGKKMHQNIKGIILKNKVVIVQGENNSYKHLLESQGIKEDCIDTTETFVQVMLIPDKNAWWLNPEEYPEAWKFSVNQNCTPKWFHQAKNEQVFREAVCAWWQKHVLVDQKINQLSAGYYWLKRCEVQKLRDDVCVLLDDSTVDEMCGHSAVTKMYGSSKISKMYEHSTVSEMFDLSVVDKMYGKSAVGEMRGRSSVGEMRENATIGKMKNSSAVSEMWNDSAIGQMYDNSAAGRTYHNSRIGMMFCNSIVGEMYSNSTVGKMNHSSKVGKMYNESVVCQMYDHSMVSELHDSSAVGAMYNSSVVNEMYQCSAVSKMYDHSTARDFSDEPRIKIYVADRSRFEMEEVMNLHEKIQSTLNGIWEKYYLEKGINSGDISPEQQVKYAGLICEIERLIQESAEQNK